MNKRIKELRKALNLTQAEFAARAGVAEMTAHRWEYGKTLIKETSLRAIESSFGVNPRWLREGEGEMFVTPTGDIHADNDYDTGVPFFNNVRVSAGLGAEVLDEVSTGYNFSRHALAAMRQHSGKLSVICVEGNSMEPQFRAGDQLFVDTSQLNLDREGIYVIRMRSAIVVKMVQVEPDGCRLISHNPKYRDIELKGGYDDCNEDMMVVGRVIGAVTFTF